MKSKEQMLAKNHWNQRTGRSKGHITENRGLMERDGDNRKGRAGWHRLNKRTGGLEGRQGGEIKTRGGEVMVDCREAGLLRRNWNRAESGL